ncbi:MAG: hypothetical protein ACOC9P_00870, partial [bacterium]
AQYLREGIAKMTGQTPEVISTNDLSRGIVLTTLDAAPSALRNDPDVRDALKNTGDDAYNHNEAFFVRSEDERVVLIANTPDGLLSAAVTLLESVEYEVLGMGPNWIHAPDHRERPLIFEIEHSDRPSYYIRNLWATSGQQRGVGTLREVDDPDNEPATVSYRRWRIGTRMAGQSMPGFPGHALQGFHNDVAAKMIETGTTEGFLVENCVIGSIDERPEASEANDGTLWLSTETNDRGQVRAFLSDGEKWNERNPHGYGGANLDLTVPLVREVILEKMKERAEKHFEENPDEVFIFGTDPEDGGGYYTFAERIRYPNWYPEYRKEIGDPLGDDYVLHGFKGLDQPKEMWDPEAPGDTVFGFNNWLLREFDQWIESLPESQRVTETGQSKKELVRCSLYCYNFHDVPPNFNLDERIRVMIAGYPKHRGRGKWENFASQLDMAQAYQVMLPREPSGTYRIISLAYYRDRSPAGLAPTWSAAPADLVEDYGSTFDAGIKAMSVETDFNFGRFGLGYYLITKLLWNADMTAEQLDATRDRWLQRAYGSGWREMKEYYDYRLADNYPVNAPNTWAKAIRMIDAADEKIDPAAEPDAQRRLDDLKQYWYYYYLEETGQGESDSDAMREFVWKGQMSYMVALHAVVRRIFGTSNVREAAGEYATGPARYTHEEIQQRWKQVLDEWRVTPVTQFDERTLADGRAAADVDLLDLVPVRELQGGPSDQPFYINSYDVRSITVATYARRANERIGFQMHWPYRPDRGEAYDARDLSYGMDRWNPDDQQWEALIDKTMTAASSRKARNAKGDPVQYVRVQEAAPQPGMYRFDVGRGGRLARLTSLGYDMRDGEYRRTLPFAYLDVKRGLTQSPVFFYIPKGTESLDFEADNDLRKTLVLYTGLPVEGMSESRQVDVSAMGTHTIELQPGEAGTVAELRSNGFSFPYMYSIYSLWAKSPGALLVPRDVAEADGLTIVE